jgi:hypothetical protein
LLDSDKNDESVGILATADQEAEDTVGVLTVTNETAFDDNLAD